MFQDCMVSDATIAFLGMLDTDRAAGQAHPIAPFHLLRSPHVPARTRSNRGRSGKRCRWPSQLEIPAWQIIRHRTGFKPGRPATQIARCRRGDKRHPHQVVFLEFLVEAPLSTATSNFREARLRWQHIARQHDFWLYGSIRTDPVKLRVALLAAYPPDNATTS